MRYPIWGLLVVVMCVSLTGCGGCGGGVSEADMRRFSRKRSPEELADLPAAEVQAANQQSKAQSETVGGDAESTSAAKASAVAQAEARPAPSAAESASTVPATSDQARPAPAARPQVGPVQVVVRNARPATSLTAEEKRLRSIANLQRLGEALTAYAERTGALPAVIRDPQGAPLLSWRVALLPDLGHGELYRQFRLDEAWDSPHNRQLLPQIPPELQSPERFDQKTNYLGLAGSGHAFGTSRGVVPRAMEDGPENTIAVVEVDEHRAAAWTAPEDFVPQADRPRYDLNRLRGDGAFALLANGQVVSLPAALVDHQLLALFSPDGGEQIVAADLVSQPAGEAATVAAAPTVPESPLLATNLPVEGAKEATPSAIAQGGLPPAGLVKPGDSPPPTDSSQIAVPSEGALAAARELFRDLYGKQYEEARKPEDKEEFAKLMLVESAKVQANPAHYYELLRIARDIAAAGGDATTAFQAAELMCQRFQVDAPAVRLKVLDDLSKAPGKTEAAETLRQEALQVLLDAFDADNFDVALPAYDRLVEFTRLTGDRTEMARLTKRKQPLEAARQAYQAAVEASETLKTNPDDGVASETLGKYLCFVKNRWEAGLPHLVRAAEVKLRVVATIDLESGRSPQDTLSLADQYWEMAGSYKQPFTRGLHLRAALCYQTAKDTLPDGLEKLKAQKRIDVVGEIYGKEVLEREFTPLASRTAATSD